MTTPEQTDRTVAASPSLSVPASPHQLGLLRATVRTVAAQNALSMDTLADVVLAVDEAATTLINHARPAAALVCTFDTDTDPSRLRIILTTTTSSPLDASTSSFGWLVLHTLVDHVALEQSPAGSDDQRATITLEKALQASS